MMSLVKLWTLIKPGLMGEPERSTKPPFNTKILRTREIWMKDRRVYKIRQKDAHAVVFH